MHLSLPSSDLPPSPASFMPTPSPSPVLTPSSYSGDSSCSDDADVATHDLSRKRRRSDNSDLESDSGSETSEHIQKRSRYLHLQGRDTSIFCSAFKTRFVVAPSVFPFKMIERLATSALQPFIKTMIRSSMCEDQDSPESLLTSCVVTARSIAGIFFPHSVEDMFRLFCQTLSIPVRISLPNGGTYQCTVNNLFGGPLFFEMAQNQRGILNLRGHRDRDKAACYVDSYRKRFCQSIEPKIAAQNHLSQTEIIASVENIIKNTTYQFNLESINYLISEINTNKQTVKPNCSFIYWINVIGSAAHDHMFFIEQFIHHGNVCFRLYQSWIRKATLVNEWERQRKKYGSEILNEIQMDQFLACFSQTFNSGKSGSVNYKECFGYSAQSQPLLEFAYGTLSGTSVRYYSSSFNPSDCINRMVDLVKTTPAIQSALEQAEPLA